MLHSSNWGVLDEWLVIPDVAITFDNILDGHNYKVEQCLCSPEMGEMLVELKHM